MKNGVYTTTEVAKLCHVSPQTVNKWVDSGYIKGFRIPSSRHRRVLHDDLVKFAKHHGIALNSLKDRAYVVMDGETILFITEQQEFANSEVNRLVRESGVIAHKFHCVAVPIKEKQE